LAPLDEVGTRLALASCTAVEQCDLARSGHVDELHQKHLVGKKAVNDVTDIDVTN
jgi:hypothetical protein